MDFTFQLQGIPTPEIFLSSLLNGMTGFISAGIAIGNGGSNYAAAHGLASIPSIIGACLLCVADDSASGYSNGDIIDIRSLTDTTTNETAAAVWSDSLKLNVSTPTIWTGNETNVAISKADGSGPVNPSDFNNFQIVVWGIVI